MNYDFSNPVWNGRDRLIFSKAHGCYALYAILADNGILPKEKWENFYTDKSSLPGCIERNVEYGIEASTGSLGHGLPIATGIAYGAKLQNKKYYTFCVVGDGELQEGSNWEALQFAVKHSLDNLIVIVDRNSLQAMDFIKKILDKNQKDIVNRLKGFGLSPKVCNGHKVKDLVVSIEGIKNSSSNAPGVIIAKTVKGFGLRCMENVPKFHFRVPDKKELTESVSK